jgi:hypothetical protein
MWESSRELAVAVKSLKIKKGQQEPGQHSSATFSHEFLYYKKIFIYFLSLCHQFLWVEHFHHRWATRRPSPLPSLFLKNCPPASLRRARKKNSFSFYFFPAG